MIGMFFFGIGLGFNFQPLTLAVQNAVDRKRHGRRDLVRHLHPPDRRHARHGRLPLDPLLAGRDEDHRGLPVGRVRRRPSSPRRATPRAATPQVNAQFVQQLQARRSRARRSGVGRAALQDSSFIDQLDPTPGPPVPRRASPRRCPSSSSSPRACMVFAFIATAVPPARRTSARIRARRGDAADDEGGVDARRALTAPSRGLTAARHTDAVCRPALSVGVLAPQRPHLR